MNHNQLRVDYGSCPCFIFMLSSTEFISQYILQELFSYNHASVENGFSQLFFCSYETLNLAQYHCNYNYQI